MKMGGLFYEDSLELASLEYFVVASQTACADFHFFGFAINVNRRMLNVRKPSSSGAPFGVADVVARHSSFGAYFTLGHYLPLTDIGCLGRIDAT